MVHTRYSNVNMVYYILLTWSIYNCTILLWFFYEYVYVYVVFRLATRKNNQTHETTDPITNWPLPFLLKMRWYVLNYLKTNFFQYLIYITIFYYYTYRICPSTTNAKNLTIMLLLAIQMLLKLYHRMTTTYWLYMITKWIKKPKRNKTRYVTKHHLRFSYSLLFILAKDSTMSLS